jgi:hypothetical protein
VRVWDVASGVAVAAAAAAPVASAAWCTHAAAPEFATAGADGVTLWRVTGGAVAEMQPGSPASAVGLCKLNQVDPLPITYSLSNP